MNRLLLLFKERKIEFFLFSILFFYSLYYIFFFLLIAGTRSPINFMLAPFEDYFAHALDRYNSGFPIYSIPSVEFSPYLYGPLYLYLSKPFLFFTEIRFPTLRIVSIISIIALPVIFYFILSEIKTSAKSKTLKLIATILFSGLYFVSYSFTGFWMDLAKVDSLLVFWLFLSYFIYLKVLNSNSNISKLLFIILLAFFSSEFIFIKQSMLGIPVIFFILLFIYRTVKESFSFLFFFILFEAILVFHELNIPNNHYLFFNFLLPALHPFTEKNYVREILILIVPIFVSLGIYELYFLAKTQFTFKEYWEKIKTNSYFYSLVTITAGLIFIGILGRIKHGGFVNSLLYPYATLVALLVFIFYKKLNEEIENSRLIYFFLFLIGILQFNLLRYYPNRVYKAYLNVKAIEQDYQTKFCKLPGIVLYERISYMSKIYCNRKPFFSNYTATDILPSSEFFDPLYISYKKSLENKIFDRMIFDDSENKESTEKLLIEAKNELEKNPNVRNTNNVKLMGLFRFRFEQYEPIPPSELTKEEADYIALHNSLFPSITLYRRTSTDKK